MPKPMRIGVDTGGTFTDFIATDGSRLTAFKLPSTPHNPAEAILAGLARLLAQSQAAPLEIVHGTTVATNALLERKGAKTALITTLGFEDVIEIGRQARPEIYNLMVTRPAPLIGRDVRLGVSERVGPDGVIITSLDQRELAELVDRITKQRVESIAVCFLFSFANPAHEQEVGKLVEKTGIPISLSHRILPEYREYERTSTVVINAYLVPLMARYLRSLADELQSMIGRSAIAAGRGTLLASQRVKSTEATSRKLSRNREGVTLRVMQSNGGSVSAATAAVEPVRAILSGPAGGVVGALRVCALAGIRDIITFDMGGTSTDVSLCRGEARTTNEALVAGLPVAVPVIDIHTVGAGGGSIARMDAAGALRVGPESAGADPGPACYGKGEQVTVTDANLVLGRFGGAGLLGGEMRLDLERATHFVSKLAGEMSKFSARRVTLERAALGVIRVANANMERALRVVSVERGQDPRLFTLVSFGGAGGLHVCDLASQLRIPRVVVPRSPGTLSALGVLLGDVVKDYSRTVMERTEAASIARIEEYFALLEREAQRELGLEGFDAARVKLARSAAMRYIGQSFEIEVRWSKRFEAQFHRAHQDRYGYADARRPAEIVSIRVRASGITEKPRLRRATVRGRRKIEPSRTARVHLTERPAEVPVYVRERLGAGDKIKGPAIITEYSSTTLIPAFRSVEVDPWLNLIIS